MKRFFIVTFIFYLGININFALAATPTPISTPQGCPNGTHLNCVAVNDPYPDSGDACCSRCGCAGGLLLGGFPGCTFCPDGKLCVDNQNCASGYCNFTGVCSTNSTSTPAPTSTPTPVPMPKGGFKL